MSMPAHSRVAIPEARSSMPVAHRSLQRKCACRPSGRDSGCRSCSQVQGEEAASPPPGSRLEPPARAFDHDFARVSVHSDGDLLARQPADAPSDGRPGCNVAAGIPNSDCSAYAANAWWLPSAYVNNATCACVETPNVPTANCVRKFLQDRLAATPAWLKAAAAAQKPYDTIGHPLYHTYQVFVQTLLTPRIYQDHVDAYASCCCPSGPAVYPSWIGVTTVPLPCSAVGDAIRYFGSCHGTPGTW